MLCRAHSALHPRPLAISQTQMQVADHPPCMNRHELVLLVLHALFYGPRPAYGTASLATPFASSWHHPSGRRRLSLDLSSAQSIWSELDKIPQEGTFILADIGKFIAENKCFNLLESAGM